MGHAVRNHSGVKESGLFIKNHRKLFQDNLFFLKPDAYMPVGRKFDYFDDFLILYEKDSLTLLTVVEAGALKYEPFFSISV